MQRPPSQSGVPFLRALLLILVQRDGIPDRTLRLSFCRYRIVASLSGVPRVLCRLSWFVVLRAALAMLSTGEGAGLSLKILRMHRLRIQEVSGLSGGAF